MLDKDVILDYSFFFTGITEECPLESCILQYVDNNAVFQTYDGDKNSRNGASTSSSGKVTLIHDGFVLPAPSKLRL